MKFIFVNLPVKDLERSKAFFNGLGYKFNPQFSNDKVASLAVDENIYVMLLVEPFFKMLAKRDVVDNAVAVESAIRLSMDSKDGVDTWVRKALSLGATENVVPEMNMDESMYGRSVNDLDGHIWEIVWMDPKMIAPFAP